MTPDPSIVYFGSVKQGNRGIFASFAAKVDEVVKKLDFSTIEKKDKVAIKMHLGYRDGYQTVPVFFVRRIVEAVKKTGAYPFITDVPTSVYNAVNRGYTQETCGCPLIPIAGLKDKYIYESEVNFHGLRSLDMAGVLHDADALIDLSHVKGHNTCGFGGAIKNIALGGYSLPSRWHRIHGIERSIPYWDAEKCTPEHAKELVKSCKDGYISYKEEEHRLNLDFSMCYQCLDCIKADRDVECLTLRPENFALFQELIAIGANNVLKTFDENKRFFINLAISITALCDCWGIAQPNIVNDVGVLGSRDIVAVETASLDLIAKEGLIESMVPPYIRLHNDPGLHPFTRLHGPMKSPYLALEYAEKLGMGSRNYKLIELLSPEKTLKMKPPKSVSEVEPTFF